MPIPPYLKKTSLKKDELLAKYQSIFAREKGSSAAPTASLHFTEKVFEKLGEKGIGKHFVTLHVGMGTFAPLTKDNLENKTLHHESYLIDKDTYDLILKEKKQGKKLVSVGTTVTRTLESVAKTGLLAVKTDLFIYPPYNFKMVDHLITNFHLPKSSLMMLVEAFLQNKRAKRKLINLYNVAIENKFRFYSFGDAMLIK
jgi:S-adenosylmethionine:tRNA ribosyltransferase-isomerase